MAEIVAQAAPPAIPLPVDLDDWEQQQEEQMAFLLPEEVQVPQLLLPTLADAQRAASRVRYFRQQAAEMAAVFASEVAVLEAELARVKQRRDEALAPWQRRESWYVMALEQFARERLAADPKQKTIRLPAGDLQLRAQQPEWNYGDEAALGAWLKEVAPGFIKPVPNKAELKKAVEVRPDGTVMLPWSGEILPGVRVTERPPAFTVKTEV